MYSDFLDPEMEAISKINKNLEQVVGLLKECRIQVNLLSEISAGTPEEQIILEYQKHYNAISQHFVKFMSTSLALGRSLLTRSNQRLSDDLDGHKK